MYIFVAISHIFVVVFLGFLGVLFGSPRHVLSPLTSNRMNEPIAEWTGTRSCEVPPGDGAAREGKAGGLRDGAHPPEGCHRMLPKGGSQPLRQVSGRMRKVLQCRDQEGCGTSSSGLGGQGQARWLVIWVGSEEERLCTRPYPIPVPVCVSQAAGVGRQPAGWMDGWMDAAAASKQGLHLAAVYLRLSALPLICTLA